MTLRISLKHLLLYVVYEVFAFLHRSRLRDYPYDGFRVRKADVDPFLLLLVQQFNSVYCDELVVVRMILGTAAELLDIL